MQIIQNARLDEAQAGIKIAGRNISNLSYADNTSLVAQMVKRLSTMRETWVQSLGWEEPLEKEMAIHSSTIAWKIRRQRSLVGYSPWGCKESDMTEQLHSLTHSKDGKD